MFRRTNNPLLRAFRTLLPFLPSNREKARRHEHLYKIYDGLLDQLEVFSHPGLREMFNHYVQGSAASGFAPGACPVGLQGEV